MVNRVFCDYYILQFFEVNDVCFKTNKNLLCRYHDIPEDGVNGDMPRSPEPQQATSPPPVKTNVALRKTNSVAHMFERDRMRRGSDASVKRAESMKVGPSSKPPKRTPSFTTRRRGSLRSKPTGKFPQNYLIVVYLRSFFRCRSSTCRGRSLPGAKTTFVTRPKESYQQGLEKFLHRPVRATVVFFQEQRRFRRKQSQLSSDKHPQRYLYHSRGLPETETHFQVNHHRRFGIPLLLQLRSGHDGLDKQDHFQG